MRPVSDGSAIAIEMGVVLGFWRDRMIVRGVNMIRGGACEMLVMPTEFLQEVSAERS